MALSNPVMFRWTDNGQRPYNLSWFYWTDDQGGIHYQWWDRDAGSQIYSLWAVGHKSYEQFDGYEALIKDSSEYFRIVDADGNFVMTGPILEDKWGGYAEAGVTVRPIWIDLAYTVTLNRGVGTGGTQYVYQDHSGNWFADYAMTTPLSPPITIPTAPSGKRFLGYFSSSASSGGTQYVNADGTFTAAFYALRLSGNRTFYARYQEVSYQITLSAGSGSGGTQNLYYKIDGGGVFEDSVCTIPATAITIPTYASHRFLGYFSTVSEGTQYIDATGTILPALQSIVLSANVTIHAQWSALYAITLDKAGGTGGTPGLWYDSATDTFYGDEQFLSPITSVIPPTKAGNTFLGYYSSAIGGTQYIAPDGTFTAAFPAITSNLTFYAHWDVKAIVLTLDAAGGEGAPSKIFYKPSVGWFLDESLSVSITAITVPTRAGYTFGGYFTDGVTQTISTDGTILVASILSDTTSVASWTAQSFTLSFDYNGGIPGVESKTVTMGQPIGALPTTSKSGLIFTGWILGTRILSASTVWDIASNATAIAEFGGSVGYHIDWFGLASNALVPIASDSGDGAKRVTVYHTGQIEPGVGQTSGTWRNPSVTYRVVKDVNFSTTLGLAFAAANANTTGYMITEVDVQTEVGQFPTVRVSAVANEGANAINLFPITIPIVANAHAQRLLNAVTGNHLQSCSLSARCQPVIVEENLMPVASDVVAAKITVNATTVSLIPGMEYAPRAGSGFTAVNSPTIGTDGQCQSFSITVEKDMTKA